MPATSSRSELSSTSGAPTTASPEERSTWKRVNSTPATRAKALCRFGLFAHVQGDEARAVAAFEAGLALAQSIDARAEVANAQFLLGFVAIDAGDYEAATRAISSALAFCQELHSRPFHKDIIWQLPSGTRVEVIDDEEAAWLAKTNGKALNYAPESGSE